MQGERRRSHRPLVPRDDGVDAQEVWLDELLQIGHFVVEAMVVVDEPVSVILQTDVVLGPEGDGCPRMSLELRRVDEEVGPQHRLWRVDDVPQPIWMA